MYAKKVNLDFEISLTSKPIIIKPLHKKGSFVVLSICLDLRQLVTRGGHENGMKNILDSDIALHAFGSNCSFVASFMSILMHSLL